MPNDVFRYDLRVQEALRGVVRTVLIEAGRDGLPGNHHFYITFLTNAPGVRLSNALRERYPQEMTIVLQHHFWDLKVTDLQFEVGLSFSNIPEKLVIPFAAVTGFWDPSVNFILQFETDMGGTAAQAEPDGAEPKAAAGMKRSANRGKASEPAETPPVTAARDKPAAATKPVEKPAAAAKPVEKPAAAAEADKSAKPEADSEPKVVSLDSFRRKT
jgi:hypothetical protein